MRAGRVVEISVSPLFSVLGREDLGEPHTVLAGGERYYSPRFVGDGVVRRELEEAGFGDERDYRELVDLVRVVQRATAEFYAWVAGADGEYAILAAAWGRRGVCLVRHGDSVRFERCAADRLAEALVSRLPDSAIGRGEPITVSHAEFHARQKGGLMRRPAQARPVEARRLDALLDVRRVHVAKVYAAKRDDAGDRQRSQRWVTVLDLVDGRWALTVSRARQQDWISARPGTPAVLAEKLGELARSIR
ncbi:ESX secretion-associated protein EspG [Actinophytocola sp.]|uniref:ESX secretion-associated protein EspG n=1 Tax=Actinophytocola sp. TaxID=1872138 RepID=UPI003899D339